MKSFRTFLIEAKSKNSEDIFAFLLLLSQLQGIKRLRQKYLKKSEFKYSFGSIEKLEKAILHYLKEIERKNKLSPEVKKRILNQMETAKK